MIDIQSILDLFRYIIESVAYFVIKKPEILQTKDLLLIAKNSSLIKLTAKLTSLTEYLDILEEIIKEPKYLKIIQKGLANPSYRDPIINRVKELSFSDDYYTRWKAVQVLGRIVKIDSDLINWVEDVLIKGEEKILQGLNDKKEFNKLDDDKDIGSLAILSWLAPQLLDIEENNKTILEINERLANLMAAMCPPFHIPGLTASFVQGVLLGSKNPLISKHLSHNIIKVLERDYFWYTRALAARIAGNILENQPDNITAIKTLERLKSDKVSDVREAVDYTREKIPYIDESELAFNPRIISEIKDDIIREKVILKGTKDVICLNFLSKLSAFPKTKKIAMELSWKPPNNFLEDIGKDYWKLNEKLPPVIKHMEFRKISTEFCNIALETYLNSGDIKYSKAFSILKKEKETKYPMKFYISKS